MVEEVLSDRSTLEVAREADLYPNLITRWRRRYLDDRFHGISAGDTELKKLKLKICKLEQKVRKLPTYAFFKKPYHIRSFLIFYCRKDAEPHIDKEKSLKYHRLNLNVVEKKIYKRGRPKDGKKKIKSLRHNLSKELLEKEDLIIIALHI